MLYFYCNKEHSAQTGMIIYDVLIFMIIYYTIDINAIKTLQKRNLLLKEDRH